MLCGFDKINIQTRFCFSDEGPQNDLYHELHQDDNRMKHYFIYENIKELDEFIWIFEDKDEHKIPAIYDCKNGLCKISWYYWADHQDNHIIRVMDEDKALILKTLYEMRKSLVKRLETWWKKYGKEKLHTWTYWADA